MCNEPQHYGLGFISNFDYWTEQDLFKNDRLHLNMMRTNRSIDNLINYIVFSLKWHLPRLDPAQCPNLASHNPVSDSAFEAGAGSVSSIDSLTHVKSSVSPVSVSVGAASCIYNIPVLGSHQTYDYNTQILNSNTNICHKSATLIQFNTSINCKSHYICWLLSASKLW